MQRVSGCGWGWPWFEGCGGCLIGMGSDWAAADVFGLLADDIRLEILRTIARVQFAERETGETSLSFSAIYDRVDVENTSKLSYHLGELTGTFLRKGGDGYAFTYAGEQLVRFILAENYRSPPGFAPIEVSGRCLFCGESRLEAMVEGQYFMLRCQACEGPAFSYRVRPAQVRSHTGTALIDAVIWEQAGDILKLREGVCPDCAGRMATEVLAAETPIAESVPASFAASSACQQCLRWMSLPLPYSAAYHPESVSFHWEHGLDILGTGIWEFHQYLHDGRWAASQVGREPDEYLVELQCEGAVLRMFMDGDGGVVRTERVREREQGDRRI